MSRKDKREWVGLWLVRIALTALIAGAITGVWWPAIVAGIVGFALLADWT